MNLSRETVSSSGYLKTQRKKEVKDSEITPNFIKMRTIVLFVLLFPALVFSQEIVSKNLDLSNGKVKLPGTLSYPKTTGEIPLVIFIHGSGNIDRNGNQAGTFVKANYIKTLADSLNTRGIACYRYDKRTATKDNAPFF